MKLIPVYVCLFALLSPDSGGGGTAVFRQPGNEKHSVCIAFYNTENLFDTLHDAGRKDYEFLPGGKNRWNTARYREKLHHVARVILAMDDWKGAAVAGLCEVENKRVLDDLAGTTALSNFSYGYVHHESPDQRGIDVALLYRKDLFRVLQHRPVRLVFPFDTAARTRDILYVKGLLAGRDTVHVFVNHWPSRREGQAASEPRRVFAAQALRKTADSILVANPSAAIVIMGDFNDEPGDRSIAGTLGACCRPDTCKLLNVMCELQRKTGEGTHRYRGHWAMLDQVILSRSLAGGAGVYRLAEAHVLRAPWLMADDRTGTGQSPWRTYSGNKYLGGYSDHLPVYVTLDRGVGY